MKTLEELNRYLSQPVPLNPLIRALNEAFGPLGWEYDGKVLKVMAKVSEGHFLSVSRAGNSLVEAAGMFGLFEEVKNAPIQERTEVGVGSDRVGQGAREPEQAVPGGTPKPEGITSPVARKVLLESISECSKIILAKKLRTQDQLVKMVEAFAVKRKEELNEGQAMKLLEQLKEILQ